MVAFILLALSNLAAAIPIDAIKEACTTTAWKYARISTVIVGSQVALATSTISHVYECGGCTLYAETRYLPDIHPHSTTEIESGDSPTATITQTPTTTATITETATICKGGEPVIHDIETLTGHLYIRSQSATPMATATAKEASEEDRGNRIEQEKNTLHLVCPDFWRPCWTCLIRTCRDPWWCWLL
ncbi:hypothetical protein MMC28_008715 [Mycoblastus sanguinarius]|nr:hypothetical protein [Mycoblastus sanguinarius]